MWENAYVVKALADEKSIKFDNRVNSPFFPHLFPPDWFILFFLKTLISPPPAVRWKLSIISHFTKKKSSTAAVMYGKYAAKMRLHLLFSAFRLWIDGQLSINCLETSQSDGMTARLSLFHTIIIMTVLAALFWLTGHPWKCSAETQQPWVLAPKMETKKIKDIWYKHATQYTIKKEQTDR